LKTLNPAKLHKNRPEFLGVLNAALRQHKLKPPAPVLKAILSALSERDETAEICTDEKGKPDADPELRDTENVPLGEDVQEFFAREVEPHVPDVWINISVKDPQDGKIGRVGYEINFNRYFYKYQPPRPLEDIVADIRMLEREIVRMLREVAGRPGSLGANQVNQ
jgi:type I restriction enzyme M protein